MVLSFMSPVSACVGVFKQGVVRFGTKKTTD